MKSRINVMADYKEAQFEKVVSISCPSEHLTKELRHVARKFKTFQDVTTTDKGDVAVLSLESDLKKFDGQRQVTIGGGLFDIDFEQQLIGKKINQPLSLSVDGHNVKTTILSAKRACYPEPTDEMVAEFAKSMPDMENITTVEKFKEYVEQQYKQDLKMQKIYETAEIIFQYVFENSEWSFDADEVENLRKNFMKELETSFESELGKPFSEVTDAEVLLNTGIETKELLLESIPEEAKQQIGMALFQISLYGKDSKEVSLEDTYQWNWEILFDYIKDNIKFVE